MAHVTNSLKARNMPSFQRFIIEGKNFTREKRKLLLIRRTRVCNSFPLQLHAGDLKNVGGP